MIENYLIIAWRNLRKHRLFSLINLSGLVVSISVAIVVYLIVKHEFSYDQHHPHGDRIFRVVSEIDILGETFNNPGVPIPLAQVVKDNISGVDEAVELFRLHNYSVTIPGIGTNDKKLKHQDQLILTEPGYFGLFAAQWIAGHPATALQRPFQVVLTETKAKQYFGVTHASNVMGRSIIYQDSVETVVSGIIKDHDQLTDFSFQEFISISTVRESSLKDQWYLDRWDNYDSDFQLMIKLSKASTPESINEQLITQRGLHQSEYDERREKSLLQPLHDIHFNSTYAAFTRPVANKGTLLGLVVVAVLLLVLGSINYINLTTALGTQRAKEIGVRKTLGVSRKHLMFQFLTETGLVTILAALCAYFVTPLIMSLFEDLLPSGLSETSIGQPSLILFMVVLCLFVGLISGIYPGAILSKYRPMTVIKKSSPIGKNGSFVQVGLIVIQFAVANFLYHIHMGGNLTNKTCTKFGYGI